MRETVDRRNIVVLKELFVFVICKNNREEKRNKKKRAKEIIPMKSSTNTEKMEHWEGAEEKKRIPAKHINNEKKGRKKRRQRRKTSLICCCCHCSCSSLHRIHSVYFYCIRKISIQSSALHIWIYVCVCVCLRKVFEVLFRYVDIVIIDDTRQVLILLHTYIVYL